MAEIFPATLEKCFLSSNFAYQMVPNTIRSDVDGGAKVRRRFTEPVTNVNASLAMSQAQVKIFIDFYKIQLQGGVREFILNDPVTGLDRNFRLIDPPVITPIAIKKDGTPHYAINMALEIMP